MKYCSNCGKEFDDSIQMCDKCESLSFQNKKIATIEEKQGLRFAGFWIRFMASYIDNIICLIWCTLLFFSVPVLFCLGKGQTITISNINWILNDFDINMMNIFIFSVLIIGSLVYSVLFNGKISATPGKKIMGLKIININNLQKITYSIALGRYFASFLSGLILYIGYIMAAFDNEKTTLHDSICKTRVILVREDRKAKLVFSIIFLVLVILPIILFIVGIIISAYNIPRY